MDPSAAALPSAIASLTTTTFVTAREAIDAVLAMAQGVLGAGTVYIGAIDALADRLTVVAVREGAHPLGLPVGRQDHLEPDVRRRLLGAADPIWIPDLSLDADRTRLPLAADLGAASYFSVPLARADGSVFGVLGALGWNLSAPSPEALRHLRHLVEFAGSQIERHRDEMERIHEALHDVDTGLPNLTYLLERLAYPPQRESLDDGYAVLLVVGVDGLPAQEDDCAGPLMRAIGDRLRGCVRGRDFVARHADDAFAVLGAGAERVEDGEVIASRILHVFEQPLTVAGQELTVPLSIGFSLSHGLPDPDDITDLLDEATTAMRQAREHGGGCFESYDPNARDRAGDAHRPRHAGFAA